MEPPKRSQRDALSGVLLVLSPTPLAALGSAWLASSAPRGLLLLPGALGLFFVIAGMGRSRYPRLSAIFGFIAAFGTAGLLIPEVIERPVFALFSLLGLVLLARGLWRPVRVEEPKGLRSEARVSPGLAWRSVAQGAAYGALLLWTATALARWQDHLAVALSVFASEAIAILLFLPGLFRSRRRHRRLFGGGLTLMIALTILMTGWGSIPSGLAGGALILLFALWSLRRSPIEDLDWWEPVLETPQRLLAVTFLALALVGGLLLSLPLSAGSGRQISTLDAIFTSVSAVCVTGLVVKDTAVDFSFVGQLFILFLIQAGGLGIMTFSTAAMRLLGRRMSLRQEGAVAGIVSGQRRGELYGATRRLLVVTFSLEGVGALLLLPAFLLRGDAFGRALWRALFTSVSAFCNAGFALQSDNLVGYARSPWVLHVVAGLIIAGSLSPSAVLALPRLVRRRPISAQDKIGLSATAILLFGGFFAMLATEWNGALLSYGLGDRLHNAWFQSATLRTAGFNSIDFSALAPATLTMMMLWMFFGGNVGGTAGGVKTTTATILFLSAVTAIRGRDEVSVYGRQVSQRTVYRAAAIVTVAVGSILGALLALQLTQALSTRLLAYEVVSAMGTVGLSLGATAALDGLGKIVIIVTMFLGRIGSLTLFMFLSQRVQRTPWRYPEEDIDVG